MRRILPVLLILLLLFGLFSCKNKHDTTEEVFHEVSFSTALLPYAAVTPESLSVKEGERATEPALDVTPSAGYVVIWTQDATARTAYDFSAPVRASFTLYAVEIPRTYRITYLIERGENAKTNPLTFTKETEPVRLSAPKVDFGYHFLKWSFFDDRESTVTEIPTGREGDLVLRAVIEPVEYAILYSEAGDSNPNPATYVFGTELPLESPSRTGYRFLGYTIYLDAKATPVTKLTAAFVLEHQDALFKGNGSAIYLQANWERTE